MDFSYRKLTLFIGFFLVLSLLKLFGRLEGFGEKDPKPVFRVGVRQDPKALEHSIPIARILPTDHLPSKIDLSEWFPPPLSQGRQSSSVGFALGYYLKTFTENKKKPKPLPLHSLDGKEALDHPGVFSPSFVYNATNEGKDGGSSLISGLLLLMSYGILPWKEFPYREDDYKTKPYLYSKQSLQYRIENFYKIPVPEIRQIQAQIAKETPVVVSLLLYENSLEPKPPFVLRQPEGNPLGLQAMVLVGYDNEKKAFLALNSWGESWGDRGKIWLDYTLFQKTAQAAYIVEDPPSLPQLADLKGSYPTNLYASRGNYKDRIRITWDEVRGAIGYEVYRKRPGGTQFQLIGISLNTHFEDTGVQRDLAYQYRIASVFPDSTSDISLETTEGFASTKIENSSLERITGLKASRGNFSDRIHLQWNPIPGKKEYFIFKYNPYAGQFRYIHKTESPEFIDRSARRNGEVEIYKVSLSSNPLDSQFSQAVLGYTTHRNTILAPPQTVRASKGESVQKINLEWDPVPGADSYTIFRFTQESGWEEISSTQNPFFEDTNTSFTQAYYSIIANSKLGVGSRPSFPVLGIRAATRERNLGPLPPQNIRVQLVNQAPIVRIAWNRDPNAVSYTIYKRRIGEAWKVAGTTTSHFFQENLPERELILYSVAATNLEKVEGKKSSEYPVVYSPPVPDMQRSRSFGEESKLEKWKGSWTGLYWDGKSSVVPLNLVIQEEEKGKEIIKISLNQKTIYQGDYIQETCILDPKGRFQILMAREEIALTLETSDRSILPTPATISFLRD